MGVATTGAVTAHGVPYVIVRAISDDSDGMSFEEFQAVAARECATAVLATLGT